MKVKDLISMLQKRYSEDDDIVNVFWQRADIIQHAEQHNQILTPEEVDEVLLLMENKHDACVGINWDVIDVWIEFVIAERGK